MACIACHDWFVFKFDEIMKSKLIDKLKQRFVANQFIQTLCNYSKYPNASSENNRLSIILFIDLKQPF